MCGIVGYVGTRPVVDLLLKGLKLLEYRGYDSAGVAFFQDGKIAVRKSEGRLDNVARILKAEGGVSAATCGIGHTRWATHGKPTTQNAHPHRTGHVVLVHNGIIENYQEIKRDLIKRGHKPVSETDSELFGFLVLEEMERGTKLAEAVRKSFLGVHGQCSVVVMSEKEPGLVVGVRNGSPMVAAVDPEGGVILASDAQPLLEYTKDVYFLEHGDVAIARDGKLTFVELGSGKEVQRKTTRLDWSVEKLDKQGFAHYMLKEIHEQPVTLVDTLNALLDRAKTDPFPLARQPAVDLLDAANEITIVACGTSWHAALCGKYWIEMWAQIPVNVELASEYRYRRPVSKPDMLVIGISQSGETADTLAVIRQAKEARMGTIGITNVRGSTISREADATFFMAAGPEIGVAATKTFSAQLLTLLLVAGYLGLKRKPPMAAQLPKIFEDLVKLPHLLSDALEPDGAMVKGIRETAEALYGAKGYFFIGRGYSYPIALEGALKLKEIAYVHAEGYAAGELKHGPIAMIDREMALVTLAPRDHWRDKTISNLEECKARGAVILGVGNADDAAFKSLCDHWVPIPENVKVDESLMPFVLGPVIQLISYHLAVLKGTDVDKPRNLAKSVTVE
jgi:glucosamine--fructose-6-phosphate aminotransferase (isomerizing)